MSILRTTGACRFATTLVAVALLCSGSSADAGLVWASPSQDTSVSSDVLLNGGWKGSLGRHSDGDVDRDPLAFLPLSNGGGMVPVRSVTFDLPPCVALAFCVNRVLVHTSRIELVSDRHVPQPVAAGVFRPPESSIVM